MPTGDARANDYLDGVYGSGRSSAFPATVYLALYHVRPSDAGGGTEASYVGYERFAIANNDTNFPPAADRLKELAIDAIFDAPSADTDDFLSWAFHGHLTNDDVINWADFQERLPGEAGQAIKVPAGTLVIEHV